MWKQAGTFSEIPDGAQGSLGIADGAQMPKVCLASTPQAWCGRGSCTVLLTARPKVTKALKLREERAKGHRGRKLQSATVNSDQETLQGASQAAKVAAGLLGFWVSPFLLSETSPKLPIKSPRKRGGNGGGV